jgi:hypothetical protein
MYKIGERGERTYLLGRLVELARSEASSTRVPADKFLFSSPFLPEDGNRIHLLKHCNFIIQRVDKIQNNFTYDFEFTASIIRLTHHPDDGSSAHL